MTIDSHNCDESRITRFLRHNLPEAEVQALTDHVETCPACAAKLETETAGDLWWQSANEFLTDGPYELEPLSGQTAAFDEPAQNPVVQHVLSHLSPTDDPRMLGRFGSYEVVGVVGSGGMGVVLKGFDAALDRYVAIKTLSPMLAASGSARQRFSREARAAAAVVHDNVSEIYGVAEANGLPYLVMPYVRGASLQKRIDEAGPLTLVEILRIGMQTAAGLAAAHAQGLVHRDIKPANILLSEGVERVQITDFGLARAADDASLTKTGVIAGTPQYMSPEQARGDGVDYRSDLFSLGSMLYAMCTGRPPFRAETTYGILRRITDEQPRSIREVNPEIPLWLCCIVAKLHAKSPEDRYESAAEVSETLSQCLAHVQQPEHQRLPPSVIALERQARRDAASDSAAGSPGNRRLIWVGGAALILAAIGVFLFTGEPDPTVPTGGSKSASTTPDVDSPLSDSETVSNDAFSSAVHFDSVTDWDSADNDIQELTQQADEFSTRVERLWDDLPTPTPTPPTTSNHTSQTPNGENK